MSALNNLSIAANVTQIIGFADTVFHAGKAIYELFDKARTASRNIALLLLELQALLSVVAYVHVFIKDYAASPFALEDGHTLPNIHAILSLINRDFLHLKGLVDQSASCTVSGWLGLLQSNFRWAWNDHEVVAARERLARYTQNLSAALSVTGRCAHLQMAKSCYQGTTAYLGARRNDIVLRNKVQDIEDKLRTIAQMNPLQSPSIVTTIGCPVNRATHRVSPRPSPLRSNVPCRQRALPTATSPSRAPHTPSTVTTPKSLSADYLDSSHLPAISPILYKRSMQTISLYELEDHTLLLDTCDNKLHQITKSAVMLRDALETALSTIQVKGANGICGPRICQMRMLFDLIIASALTASAAVITNHHGILSSRTQSINNEYFKPIDIRNQYGKLTYHPKKKRLDSMMTSNTSMYLEQHNAELQTWVGSVDASFLNVRSNMNQAVLYFRFQYRGCQDLGLAPFAGEFTSCNLSNRLPSVMAMTGNLSMNLSLGAHILHEKAFYMMYYKFEVPCRITAKLLEYWVPKFMAPTDWWIYMDDIIIIFQLKYGVLEGHVTRLPRRSIQINIREILEILEGKKLEF